MPRGKYPRKPAVEAAPVASSPALAQPAPSPTAAPHGTVVAPVVGGGRRPHRFADHAQSRDIDTLDEPALRAYALDIGMTRRDATGLGVDRLRAGAKSHLANHFDALTE